MLGSGKILLWIISNLVQVLVHDETVHGFLLLLEYRWLSLPVKGLRVWHWDGTEIKDIYSVVLSFCAPGT